MTTSRPPSRRRRVSRIPDLRSVGAPAVGVLAGLALVVAAFMPWYATNIGPPFSATSASGWESTDLARVAVVLGVVLALAAAAVLLDDRRMIALDRRQGDILAWAVVGAAALALLVVGYRLVFMPDPAEFLSRQIGLYVAVAAAVGGILSGLAQVATRS